LFRPRELAFKQFKCPRPQCVIYVYIYIYNNRPNILVRDHELHLGNIMCDDHRRLSVKVVSLTSIRHATFVKVVLLTSICHATFVKVVSLTSIRHATFVKVVSLTSIRHATFVKVVSLTSTRHLTFVKFVSLTSTPHVTFVKVVSLKHTSRDFRCNILTDSHTSHKGAHEFLPYISHFWPNWVKFRIRDLHVTPLNNCEFRKNRCIESRQDSNIVVSQSLHVYYHCLFHPCEFCLLKTKSDVYGTANFITTSLAAQYFFSLAHTKTCKTTASPNPARASFRFAFRVKP